MYIDPINIPTTKSDLNNQQPSWNMAAAVFLARIITNTKK